MKKTAIAILIAMLFLACISGFTAFAGDSGTLKYISDAVVTLEKTQYTYSGERFTPAATVTLNGKKLIQGTDYTVAYTSNINPGTAKAKITFIGNCSGSLSVKFKIIVAPVTSLKATSPTSSSVKLTWKAVGCDEYYVYRYSSAKKAYVLIAKPTKNSFTDKSVSQAARYYYKVKAVKHVEGKADYSGGSAKVNRCVKPAAPEISIATKDKAVRIAWSKNSRASGYQIFMCDRYDNFSRIKTVFAPSPLSYTKKGLSNDGCYWFKVRAFREIGGVRYYGDFSETRFSGEATSRLNAAVLKPHKSFYVYNRQGTSTIRGLYKLSDNDIKILDRFIAKHFNSSMTPEQKLLTTLQWLNLNVTYARGDDWNRIAGKSWVEAAFVDKLGQCAQYNGAMAAMMAYLGYDVNLVQGYRGTYPTNYWQHFWAEVNVGGVTYVMETGNYGSSGTWSYFVAAYSETTKYIRNQVNM